MKTLILTPNKNEMCGMYQLAKDLAKEFDGDIKTKNTIWNEAVRLEWNSITRHICSFTEKCLEEVHDCPHVEVSNHCESHCWHGDNK